MERRDIEPGTITFSAESSSVNENSTRMIMVELMKWITELEKNGLPIIKLTASAEFQGMMVEGHDHPLLYEADSLDCSVTCDMADLERCLNFKRISDEPIRDLLVWLEEYCSTHGWMPEKDFVEFSIKFCELFDAAFGKDLRNKIINGNNPPDEEGLSLYEYDTCDVNEILEKTKIPYHIRGTTYKSWILDRRRRGE